MYKGIIFDLDGTLLDTIDDLKDSVNYILSSYGFKTRSRQEILDFIGNGAKNLIFKALPDQQKHLIDEALDAYKKYYDSHAMIKTRPYDGIFELLSRLKTTKKLGVISNKQQQAVSILVNHYFEPIFVTVLGESSDSPKKPDPTSVLNVIKEMKLDPSQCLFVGDSEVDIETAKNAKIDVVAVSWGFRSKEKLSKLNPTYLIDNPIDLLKIVEV